MLANEDSTAWTMRRALAYSIAALAAAAKLDVDRTDADRDFFKTERDALQPLYDALTAADAALTHHQLIEGLAKQAGVVLGDAVLDRGVRLGKARMKVELKAAGKADQADHVFGSDVRELVDAPLAQEPNLVLEAVGKFGQVADFAGKAEMATDLTTRATQQKQSLADRDGAALAEGTLGGAVKVAIKDGAVALYKLEKRLDERFPKQDAYVKAFFLDVAPPKKKPATPPTQ